MEQLRVRKLCTVVCTLANCLARKSVQIEPLFSDSENITCTSYKTEDEVFQNFNLTLGKYCNFL